MRIKKITQYDESPLALSLFLPLVLSLQLLLLSLNSLLSSTQALAAFANPNSILIGDRASGMGGAFTALTDDSAAMPFYNPAGLVRMSGASFSANVNLYNKYETSFGLASDFAKAPLKLNRGFFQSLPSSTGSVMSEGPYAIALSIVTPDYDYFSGEIRSTPTTSTFLNYLDESLWFGSAFALRLTKKDSFGLTAYYTTRNLSRSMSDTYVDYNTNYAIITTEQKNLTNNSLLYILGYQRELISFEEGRLMLGLSFRFPSIEVSGNGSLAHSVIHTNSFIVDPVWENAIKSETRIPSRLALGLALEIHKKQSLSFDATLYGRENYRDLDTDKTSSDVIIHETVGNFALGYEHQIFDRVWMRMGAFTNFSSHPNPSVEGGHRRGDRVQMWGFSGNFSYMTKERVSFTAGGFYTGGIGKSTQWIGNELLVIQKNHQIFSLLIGSAYFF